MSREEYEKHKGTKQCANCDDYNVDCESEKCVNYDLKHYYRGERYFVPGGGLIKCSKCGEENCKCEEIKREFLITCHLARCTECKNSFAYVKGIVEKMTCPYCGKK